MTCGMVMVILILIIIIHIQCIHTHSNNHTDSVTDCATQSHTNLTPVISTLIVQINCLSSFADFIDFHFIDF